MAGGRPTSYKPEFAEQATKLCQLGATDADLADFFKVNTTTIWRWRSAHEEFCNALKQGKETADSLVERSLYQRAMGYSFDTEKIFQFQGEVIRAPVREHVPPDTTAAIFWLKNRRAEAWRDQSNINVRHDHSTLSDAEIDARLEVIRREEAAGGKAASKQASGKPH